MGSEAEFRAWMSAGLNGDPIAYRKLLTALSGHLRAYYRGRLGRSGRSVEETEDLVQEALFAIHLQRHTYDPGQPLTPWMYAIARYKLIDYLRRTRSSMADDPIESADDILARDDNGAVESSIDLSRLLAGLPDKTRLAIQYVKIEGLSVAEAAARCKSSESAVKVNVHRGLKALTASISRGT